MTASLRLGRRQTTKFYAVNLVGLFLYYQIESKKKKPQKNPCKKKSLHSVKIRTPMAAIFFSFFALVPVASLMREPCLMISEVNADNPKLDTTEFVELFHTSGQRTSLDGYTLVFYNGNGNVAYKVLDLNGHTTDDRGFFLVGSVDVQPKPSIQLPPNVVQNGPDAIVLYHGNVTKYSEKMNVTAAGMVDAIVYATRRSGDAEFLVRTLTPGFPVFLEDESVHDDDESIERCWFSADSWGFQVAPPSPGQHNHCAVPKSETPYINEVRLGGGQTQGFVELGVTQLAGPLVLVFVDGKTDTVSYSMDISILKNGLLLISTRDSGLKVDIAFLPGDLSVLNPQVASSGAVVLYSGSVVDFPVGSVLSMQQPLDAFVYTASDGEASANLTETLTPGRESYKILNRVDGGQSLSRCGVADWTRDPGVFIKATQTPGLPNQCLWPVSCPHNPASTVPPPLPSPGSPSSHQDFLLSEVNTDTPGSGEDSEFIEIWHPSGRQTSLDGVWLLLFNGQNSRPYREISLTGYLTDFQGYFLVGSHGLFPPPAIPLPPNTIQNGPDAVALYRRLTGPPSAAAAGIPDQDLLDAIVYRQPGTDREARDLVDALTPGQLPLLEDPNFLTGDESLSRCHSVQPADLSAFVVTTPTPMKKNACPLLPPPENVVISEVGSAHWSNHSQQETFVEIFGPPRTSLHGMVLIVYEQGDKTAYLALPLTGQTDLHGFYLVGNVMDADQHLPLGLYGAGMPSRGAVALCYGPICSHAEVTGYSDSLIDIVMFSENLQVLSTLAVSKGQQLIPALRSIEGPISLSRCSCCETRSPLAWITSTQTPRLTNHCPSSAYSSSIGLCLGSPAGDGEQRLLNCSDWVQESNSSSRQEMEMEVAVYLEKHCHCGISAFYLQGTNFSCTAEGVLSMHGSIQALSALQRELIQQAQGFHNLERGCMEFIAGLVKCTTPSLGLPIGLVVVAALLLGMLVALFVYLYKKRHPINYLSMELNEPGEEPTEL